jgi:hypothetical protein
MATTIGRVKVTQSTRSTIVAQNFAPKPEVSLGQLNDVDTQGVQNGQALIFNSSTGKYEANTIVATVVSIVGGTF